MSSERDLTAWDEVADRYVEMIGQDGDTFFRRVRAFLDIHLGDVEEAACPQAGYGMDRVRAVVCSVPTTIALACEHRRTATTRGI